MAKKEEKKIRGVYQHPEGSDVWWVQYFAEGKRHREKVGRRGDAIKLYQKRKADARRKLKLPELVPGNVVTFAHLSEMALNYTEAHHPSNLKHATTKEKILAEPFGKRAADSITPQEIDAFLTEHCKTPATANRYRSFVSLAYRLGMENGKVSVNPARLVRRRKEDNARQRYLSREEYKRILAIIKRDHPEYVQAFVVSVYTGMRWGEQYTIDWSQVSLKRKVIRLLKTKNGSQRNVPLNSVALKALTTQRKDVPHGPDDVVFPRNSDNDRCRWWFEPALAEAGIKNYTWHSNRHTFCSWLALAGVSIKEIQDLAGHKTITMAARYSHLTPQATASATERLVMES